MNPNTTPTAPPANVAKPFYLSKTLWVNVLMMLSMVLPQVREFLATNPESVVGVLAAVNVLLRFATKGAVSLSDNGMEGNAGGGFSGGSFPSLALLAAVGFSVAGFTLLPSCSVVSSAITGAPIPSTTVQRAGQSTAQPIEVASADLAQAEAEAEAADLANEPRPVNGLYDAGRAAKVAREVFTDSSK